MLKIFSSTDHTNYFEELAKHLWNLLVLLRGLRFIKTTRTQMSTKKSELTIKLDKKIITFNNLFYRPEIQNRKPFLLITR